MAGCRFLFVVLHSSFLAVRMRHSRDRPPAQCCRGQRHGTLAVSPQPHATQPQQTGPWQGKCSSGMAQVAFTLAERVLTPPRQEVKVLDVKEARPLRTVLPLCTLKCVAQACWQPARQHVPACCALSLPL